MKKYFSHFSPLLIVVGVGILLAWETLKPGYMESHDAIWHVRRVYEMFAMLREGYFPVRFGLTLDNYFGIPIFNFVYVLPYYFSSLLQYLRLGFLASYNLSFTFAYLMGGLGIYFLFSKNKLIAVTSSLLYLMVPYQFLDMFVRGAVGETFFFGFFPWAMLALTHLDQSGKLKWYHPVPLSLALLSHNFLGLIFLILSAFYLLIFGKFKKQGFISIALSLLLSAFFLMPMYGERHMLLSGLGNDFTFNYAQHFVYPKQLIYSPWVYWGSFPGQSDLDMSFQLGLANIAVFGLSFLLFLRARDKKIGTLLLLVALSIYAMLPYSDWLWKLVKPVQIIQFPWRLLAVTTLATPLLGAWVLSRIPRKVLIPFSFMLLAIAFYNVRNYRRPVDRLDQTRFMEKYVLFSGKTASAVRNEFAPKWSIKEPWAPDNNGLYPTKFIGIENGPTKLELVRERPGEIIVKTNAENERAVVIIYRNYFPSWKAVMDDQVKTELKPSESGAILLPLTPGEHTYRIYLSQTPLEIISNILSLLGAVAIIYIWLKSRKLSSAH